MKKLTVSCFDRAELHALFENPKPALEALEFSWPEEKLCKEVVDKMKLSRCKLRKFCAEIPDEEILREKDEVANEVKLWCSFLKGCPNLESVRLDFSFNPEALYFFAKVFSAKVDLGHV